jgi:hypothetical protein
MILALGPEILICNRAGSSPSPCHQLPQAKVRTHQPAPTQEEVEIVNSPPISFGVVPIRVFLHLPAYFWFGHVQREGKDRKRYGGFCFVEGTKHFRDASIRNGRGVIISVCAPKAYSAGSGVFRAWYRLGSGNQSWMHLLIYMAILPGYPM